MDEAGRGAWAGPLVAGAVILPHPDVLRANGRGEDLLRQLAALRDSKMLSPNTREELLETVHRLAVAVGVGVVSSQVVDVIGLGPANRLAMTRAVRVLPVTPDYLLLDAFPLRAMPISQRPIIRGDATCISIAAASIVAKVARDRMMREQDECYPHYGFAQHKGYGTHQHAKALALFGVTPIHRCSYAPVKAVLDDRRQTTMRET